MKINKAHLKVGKSANILENPNMEILLRNKLKAD
jgi:hypothetical protein